MQVSTSESSSMTLIPAQQAYLDDLHAWRSDMSERLRAEDGWLTLVGLHWLREGQNTVGSDLSCDVVLPASAPAFLGCITLGTHQAVWKTADDVVVNVDGQPVDTAFLRDETGKLQPVTISVGSITFFVIKRADQYAVRVRDSQNPDRFTFTGRVWFPPDPAFRLVGQFNAHPIPRQVEVENTVGQHILLESTGVVTFSLDGRDLRLVAYTATPGVISFVFRDATSGSLTYSACRFMSSTVDEKGTVDLDFNRAYHPPCAFTHYATCPLPVPEDHLPVAIPAGERLA